MVPGGDKTGPSATAPRAVGRVLIADDDLILCRVLTRILVDAGHSAEAVLRGDEARDRVATQEYDVILSDVNMPGMTGPELLGECRRRWPYTEVILITGEPHLAAAVQCMKEGAFDYLSKPVDSLVLRAKVSSAVESARGRRQTTESVATTPAVPPGIRVVRSLGSGAMGIVLLVEKDGQAFAMKVLRTDLNEEGRSGAHRRFYREASILSGINHPGIVRVFDWGSTPAAQPFILMEYVAGRTLGALAAEGGLSLPRKLDLLRQVACALQFIHRRGIIHRDVKPSNVLVTADQTAKLTDFGVARFTSMRSSLTQVGSVVGSPAYMAPETFSGAEPDRLADVFSLGVLSYELLTGVSPFRGENLQQLVHSLTQDTPAPIETLAPELPAAVRSVVMRMIAKVPAERCQWVDEFLAAVSAAGRRL
jgi:CheY-like chemotaxis protein